jgi:hypothetical protein
MKNKTDPRSDANGKNDENVTNERDAARHVKTP